jgi:lysophospholipase L1-like esterase
MSIFIRRGDARLRRRSIKDALLVACFALVAGVAQAAGQPQWITSWAAAMTPGVPGGPGTYAGRTVRAVVHLSVGGPAIRIHISNLYGGDFLTIGAAHVALSRGGGAIDPKTDTVLTFSGNPSIVAPPGAALVSDSLSIPVKAASDLVISLYIKSGPLATIHRIADTLTYVAAGDQVSARSLVKPTTLTFRPYIAGVDVGVSSGMSVIALGDSVTDAPTTTFGVPVRWTDRLAARLIGRYGNAVGVGNAGISGNALWQGGDGPTGFARFNEDVLARAGRKWLILFEGLNDIDFAKTHPSWAATAGEIIAIDRQLIESAHDAGMRIYGATLLPFSGSSSYSDAGEQNRLAVNAFIRNSGLFDAVADTDAALRDPKQPNRLLPLFDRGDHKHPSTIGMQAIADTFDLSILSPSAGD